MYSNEAITVVWKPGSCIHSTLCWKGLIEVFNPKERPWVKMDGASTEQIIGQVNKCPSGALSYFMNDGSGIIAESEKPATEIPVLKVEVIPDGPYRVKTECQIVHSDGREETKSASFSLCRCGASGNKPFCDGSHRKIDFKG